MPWPGVALCRPGGWRECGRTGRARAPRWPGKRFPAPVVAGGLGPTQKNPLVQLVPDADTGRMTIASAAADAAHAAVPGSWNFLRCLANVIELEETLGMVTGMIATLREHLMAVLPEFGSPGVRRQGARQPTNWNQSESLPGTADVLRKAAPARRSTPSPMRPSNC